MRSYAKEIDFRSGRAGGANKPQIMKAEFRRGYTVPGFEYQTFGMMQRTLWQSKNQILRIVPGVGPDGSILPQNINVESYGDEDGGAPDYSSYVSDTFCKVNTIANMGDSKLTVISDYEPGSEWDRQYGGNTVLSWFARNVTDAVTRGRGRLKAIPQWSDWVNLSAGGKLRKAKPSLLFQAMVFMANGTWSATMQDGVEVPLVDANGNVQPLYCLVVIDHQRSIANLMQALVEPKDPNLPLDGKANNKFAGIAELDGSMLYLNSCDDPAARDRGFKMLKPSVQAQGKGWTPTPMPLDADFVKSVWVPWERLLQFHTPQEQASMLAQEFGADTVNYVIGMEPQFRGLQLPDEITRAGLGRYAQPGMDTQPQGVRINVQQPKVAAAQFGTAPQPPKAAPRKSAFDAVPANAGVDMVKLRQQMAAMHKAKEPVDDQAAAAQDLLNAMPDDTDFPDEEGNI